MEQKHHTELWLFAFLTFVVGDSITTAIGLSRGVAESNPAGAYVLAHAGRPGMVAFRAGILLGLYALYYGFDRTTPYDVDDLAALFVGSIGVLVAAWNVYVIFW